MKYYDTDSIGTFAYGWYRTNPTGFGKVFMYCSKIFHDNECELVNIYADTDIMAFIFKKNGAYHSANCSIKNYNDFLDSAEKNDFESSAGMTLKVIAQIARVEEVKL